ncbi:MAG: DEAD/DEAH box helicase [Prevotella sp.]|nr:DEAD/DEAH box helicase [Prevotella sp.]
MDTPLADKFASSRILQTMACTLREYDYSELRNLYELYELHVTPIESNARAWLDAGVVCGEMPRRYNHSNKVEISPDVWADVMLKVTPDDLEFILNEIRHSGGEVSPFLSYFLKSFCCAMHDKPFEEDLKRVPWPILIRQQPLVELIVHCLVHRADYVVFTSHLPGTVLRQAYYHEYVFEWMKLAPVVDSEVVRQLFFDNELLDKELRQLFYDAYLYHVEFLKTGKMAEVLGRMTSGSEYHLKLSALQKLHEGDASGALELFRKVLKEKDEDFFNEALTNFAYALALGMSISTHRATRDISAMRKKAESFLGSRKVSAIDACYAFLLVLHHYLKGDAAKFYEQVPLQGCHDKMSWRLSTLFVYHYQIQEKDTAEVIAAADYVAHEDSDYLRLLYSFDYDKLRPSAGQLQEQTGLTTSLLPKVKRLAPWERAMEELLSLNRPAVAKAVHTVSLEMERVAYVVNLTYYSVQPKLQKSKDGGITWSKGRNIALKSFENSRSSYMTAQDRQVARMVRSYSYGWYGQTAYELSGKSVIAALAGCQCVFDELTDQRIDIIEESLQITVKPCAEGFSVRSNVNLNILDDSGLCITQESNRQLTVVRVNAKQKQTLSLLDDVGIFPTESKPQLTQLLQNLSSTFTIMSPLLKNATDLKHVEASSLIAVQIAPVVANSLSQMGTQTGQFFSITLAVRPFGDEGKDAKSTPYQQPGQGMEIVSTKIGGERLQTERDLKAEKSNLEAVRRLMQPFANDETDENRWMIDTAQCLQLLELLRTAQDVAFVEWPQGVRMRVLRPVITADKLRLKISSAGQWFELEGEISIGDKEKLKMADLLERLRLSEGNFIRLDDDEYVALSEQLRKQLDAIDKMLIGRGKQLKMSTMNGLQLEALEQLGAKVKADESFQQLMSRISESGKMTFPVPTNIHAQLRPYQQQGYEWMSRLAHWGAGACLADDMGLGKTLQAITMMQARASQGPSLVLMPTSLLHNWQQELKRFAPALCVSMLNQQGVDRQQLIEGADAGDVVLSTYGLLVTEGEMLCQRTWATVVLDEAHTIKNRETQTSKAAMNLKADFRLMLTGTPLQNHLSEIWNLFQFANPGLLGSYQQFNDRFIIPIERDHNQERQRLLRRLLSPFLLRRTKDDVLSELPEKTEITIRVELSADEMALYDNLRQQAIANLEEGSRSALQTLAEITRLRQAACHPRLINEKLLTPSSKTSAFLHLVEELRQSGHRALVFSQFTSHLALIREALDAQDIPYLYLDGSTPSAERDRLVRQFQTGDQPLFLISLKAGGLGLNLTAADYVVHLDPWWNPAVEDQASDRAHRIGQERPVTVYRLIAAGTIEEKILRLHHNKRSMADALLQGADLYAQISADDIIRLLREGVDAIGE